MLLLDEADANLDTGTRQKLGEILSSYDGTILLITHDQTFIDQADDIWRLSPSPFMLINNDEITSLIRADHAGV